MTMQSRVTSRTLVVLAVAQVVAVGVVLAGSREVSPVPRTGASAEVGQDLGGVKLTSDAGQPTLLRELVRGSEWTAVLAVHSRCAWCDSISPDWRRVLQQPNRYRIVFLGREPLDSLSSYLEAKSLYAPFATVFGAADGSVERAIAGRTPWVYLVDSTGTLRYSEHGSALSVLDSVIGDLSGTGQ